MKIISAMKSWININGCRSSHQAWLVGVLGLAILGSSGIATAENNQTADSQISSCVTPYQPFVKVGEGVSSAAEDDILLGSVKKMQVGGFSAAVGDLETFAATYTNSPWVSSVQANLGRYYYEHAMFGKASEQWRTVWNATRMENGGTGKQVADFAIAYWTKMLLGLGDIDEVKMLFAQAEGRIMSKPIWQQMVNNTRVQCNSMQAQTDVAFRCGVYALNHVLSVLKPGVIYDHDKINQMASPVTGFSINKLAEIAHLAGVEMTVVKAVANDNPPVPSVVHWKDKHYAALVSEKNGLYEVIDTIYGKPRWLASRQIRQEASGYYLVVKGKIPAGMEIVSTNESDNVFGRGYVTGVNDGDDSSDNNSGGCPGASGGPGGGGFGGGGFGGGGPGGGGLGRDYGVAAKALAASSSGSCSSCQSGSSSDSTGGDNASCPADPNLCPGMPIWKVSEPYINVWLYDEPLGYQPGLGNRISFELAYKQRETRDLYDGVSENYTGVGPLWNVSWVSYLYQNITYTTNSELTTDGTNYWQIEVITTNMLGTATLITQGGGTRTFTADGVTPEYYSHGVMTRSFDSNGYWKECMITYPNGSKEVYEVVTPFPLVVADSQILYRTAKIDRFGNAIRFYYQTSHPLLQYVVDSDGRTNTLFYTGSLITQVRDPFGRTANLRYNSAGVLTNITDTAGLSSSFEYDAAGQLTKLVTPYGTTGFEHFTGNGDGSDPLIRAVRVTDAAGGTNVYMWRQTADYDIPWYPDMCPIIGITGIEWNFSNLWYRNSLYWGPLQAVNLSADLHTISYTDTKSARVRHWSHDRNDTSLISQNLELEVLPVPQPDYDYPYRNTTQYMYGRMLTWYAYDGQTNCQAGTESKPALIVRKSTDDTVGFVWYRRDTLGHAINVVDTYTPNTDVWDVNPLTRTNIFIYDANGIDMIAHIGPKGEMVAGVAYNSNHQVVRQTNALNEVTQYSYDTNGRLVGTITPSGLITTNTYYNSGSGLNFVQSIINYPVNTTNVFTYTNDLVYTRTDERGLTTTNTWDGLNRLCRMDYPDGTFVTNSYNRLDVVQVQDRMGFKTSYGYNPLRQLVAKTNALYNYTLYNYCPCGSLEGIQDSLGNAIVFSYDNAGFRSGVTYSDGYWIYYTYDAAGHLVSTIDSGGASVTNWYNNQGLLSEVDNAAGIETINYYDVEDYITNSVNANGVSVCNTYDLLGRVLTRSYPDRGVESFGYSFGIRGPTSYTNQIGQVTRYAYDAAGRKTAETNALNYATLFNYNPAGDLLGLTDGNGNKTTWRYDIYGRVTNKVDAASNLLFVYGYDADNRLTNRWSAAKGNTAYAYDPVGNLTRVTYPVSTAITLKYDALNRLTNMVDGVGTTVYGYDTVGELLSEDGPWSNDTVSYHYQNRLRTGLSVPSSDGPVWTEGYGYDLARRLTSVSSYAGVFSYAYDPVALQQVDQLNLSSGAYITNYYDSNARLTGTWLMNSGGTNLDSYAYSYNQANQRTNVVRTAGDYINYTYDNIGELTTAFGFNPAGAVRLNEYLYYYYDAAGNLLKKKPLHSVPSQTSYGINVLNQITNATLGCVYNSGWEAILVVSGSTTFSANSVTINGASAYLYGDNSFALNEIVTNGLNTFTAIGVDSLGVSSTNFSTVNVLYTNNAYAYDLNGNLLTDGTRGFAYDDENQLISVWKTNVWRNDFVYDGKMRRRIAKAYTWTNSAWAQTNEVHYIYDGNLVVQERDASNTSLVSYTRGRDLSGSLQGAGGIGGLLARTDHGGQAYRSWYVLNGGADMFNYTGNAYYHCDGNGNVTCLISPNQTVVAKYLYDPFGNTLAQSGPLAEANPYRFSSKEWNANSGLYYYLYRFYDPNLQRWLNRDPIGEKGGLNLYTFVANQPTRFMDRWGLTGCGDGWGGMLYPPNQGPGLPSKGNCWRFACGNPQAPGDPPWPSPSHQLAPPGWNKASSGGCSDPCKALMDGINGAGGKSPDTSGNCPSGYHKINVQYSSNMGGSQDFHFSRQCPDGSWWDKPGTMEPRPAPGGPNGAAPGYQHCGTTCVPDGFNATDTP
jgi:RHS repeat-associated protein